MKWKSRWWCIAGVFLLYGICHAEFKHPGVFNSAEELNFIKKMVAEKKEPWFSAFHKIYMKEIGPTYTPIVYRTVRRGCSGDGSETNWRADCRNVYSLAYRWVVTGDKRYADAAIGILNAWKVLQNFASCGSPATKWHLSIAFSLGRMMNGAEILRYYKQPDGSTAGWSAADISAFSNTLNRIWNQVTHYNRCNGCGAGCVPGMSGNSAGNGEAGKVEAALAMGVFLNDREKWNWGVKEYYYTIDHAFAWDSGENIEDERDCGHPQMDLAHILLGAEILYQQRHLGVDGYGRNVVNGKPALYRGTEYRTALASGESRPKQNPCGRGTQRCPNAVWPTYEIPFNHYANRMKMDMPYTQKVLNSTVIWMDPKGMQSTYRPERFHWMSYGGGTLTHYGLPVNGVSHIGPTGTYTGPDPAELVLKEFQKKLSPFLSPGERMIPVAGTTASGHEGFGPDNTIDMDLDTRWSASGKGEWIQFDLGAPTGVTKVLIAWHSGNIRISTFDILVSDDGSNFSPLLKGRKSTGTLDLQATPLPNGTHKRYFRILGYGNSQNEWNSITEVVFIGKGGTIVANAGTFRRMVPGSALSHTGRTGRSVEFTDLQGRIITAEGKRMTNGSPGGGSLPPAAGIYLIHVRGFGKTGAAYIVNQ